MSQRPNAVNRELVMSALQELVDQRYQRRVWIDGSTTELSSMTEATEALFSDSFLGDSLGKNVVTFSIVIDDDLRRLRSALRSSLALESLCGTTKVVDSPEWATVRQLAGQVLNAIKATP